MRSLPLALAAVAVALVGTMPLLRAGQDGGQTPTPTFRSSAEAIQVTAIVTDANGQPVSGLTEADFEVFENNEQQAITTFSAVDIPLERVERSAAEADVLGNEGPDGRLYIIALDEVAPENALRARNFLRQFIERHFGVHDKAAVVLVGRGLRTDGQDFTGNTRLILEAIDKFSGGFGEDPMRQRNLMGSLRDLTEFLAKVPGPRKALIFVSEGIGADALDLVDYRGGVLSIAGEDFQQAVSAATRGNVAIYPLDPRGLSPDTSGAGQGNDLRALAEVTGGFALANSNSFAASFERIVRENSSYYVIGFNSAHEKRNARYVPVDVRVRRPGLRVQSLDGYVAPRGQPRERPQTESTVYAAVLDAVVSPLTLSGVPMEVFAAPYMSKGKDATVAVTVEINPKRLGLVQTDGIYRGDLDIVFVLTDARKKRWPVIRHRAALALKPETFERMQQTGLRVVSQLPPLPKGRYQLRVSAGVATLAGSVVYDLNVPDFKDGLAMSGIAVTSSRARETPTVSPQQYIDVALPGPPVTQRAFTRDDALTLFVEIYENRRKPHTLDFTMTLRKESGETVGTITATRTPADPKAGAVYRFSPSIALEDVPPGRYVVDVQARSSLDSRPTVSRKIPIQVR